MYLKGTDIGRQLEAIDRFRDFAKNRAKRLRKDYASGFEAMTSQEQRDILAELLLIAEIREQWKPMTEADRHTRELVDRFCRNAAPSKAPAKPNPKRPRWHLTTSQKAELGIPEPPRCECGKTTLLDKLAADAVVAARAPHTGVRNSYQCPLCGMWHTTKRA